MIVALDVVVLTMDTTYSGSRTQVTAFQQLCAVCRNRSYEIYSDITSLVQRLS